MKKHFVQQDPTGKRHIWTCSECRQLDLELDGTTEIDMSAIPILTQDQALEAGWTKTSDPVYCPHSEPFVWICPECSADFVVNQVDPPQLD